MFGSVAKAGLALLDPSPLAPVARQRWERIMHANARYRDQFDRDGFVIVPDFLPPGELRELRQMMDAVLDDRLKPDRPGVDAFRVQWEPRVKDDPAIARRNKIRVIFHLAHTHSYFRRLVASRRVQDLVEALLGPSPKFFTDQTFFKPARHGSEVPWHQDSAYWPHAEPRILSGWLALDDVTLENGCVRYVPGSHLRELPHHEIETDNPNKLTTQPAYVDPSREVPAVMSAGSICLHHSLTLHRSLPNHSDRSRNGMVMIFMPDDLKFHKPWPFEYGFEHLHEGLPIWDKPLPQPVSK